MIKNITIIGSGNVATQLSNAFKKNELKIVQIIARNKISGKELAKKTNSCYTDDFSRIKKTDLIIICVSDDNIQEISNKIPNNMSVVHTSGSTSLNVLKKNNNYGVIYPLQSLNKNQPIRFQNIPICIEGNNKNYERILLDLCQKITNKIYFLDSKKRKHLHLSAVIASNFSNFCYLMAKKELDKYHINFDLLKPLILQTANQILNTPPLICQTGPAKRKDKKVIKEHLTMLKDENYKKIYKLLSQSIIKEYEKQL